MNITSAELRDGLIYYLFLVISISLHEFAHAVTADHLGDNTPASQGRVTLNPLAHLDPIGTGLIPLMNIFLLRGYFNMIGWGKPVQIDLGNFPPETRMRCDLMVTFAGPATNLVIALAGTLLGVVCYTHHPDITGYCGQLVMMNVGLAAFNMLPIPPLDGSHFMRYIVGMSEETYRRMMYIGPIILLVAINLNSVQYAMSSAIVWCAQPYFALGHLLNSDAAYTMFGRYG
jgi:Zn-dependent protease